MEHQFPGDGRMGPMREDRQSEHLWEETKEVLLSLQPEPPSPAGTLAGLFLLGDRLERGKTDFDESHSFNHPSIRTDLHVNAGLSSVLVNSLAIGNALLGCAVAFRPKW